MQPAPPVFVLASPHSEVSRISAMLGQHPGIYAVPELNLFAADRPKPERVTGTQFSPS